MNSTSFNQASLPIPSAIDIKSFHTAVATYNMKNLKRQLATFGTNILDAKDETGFTALMTAAFNGNTKALTFLLEAGADVNAQSIGGYTALIWATQPKGQHHACLEILLAAGADESLRNEVGDTAYLIAQRNKMTRAEELLDPQRHERQRVEEARRKDIAAFSDGLDTPARVKSGLKLTRRPKY